MVKEGLQIYCEFKSIICLFFPLQKCAPFMNKFGKTGARFENDVQLRNVGVHLLVYVIFLSKTHEVCEAQLVGIL